CTCCRHFFKRAVVVKPRRTVSGLGGFLAGKCFAPADVGELFECVRPAGFMLLFALDRFG
ncbi:MAG: hypothetical protein WB610_06165, partial [Rhodomicrobium sp.]